MNRLNIYFQSTGGVLVSYNLDLVSALCKYDRLDITLDVFSAILLYYATQYKLRGRLCARIRPFGLFNMLMFPSSYLGGFIHRFDVFHLNGFHGLTKRLINISKSKIFVLHAYSAPSNVITDVCSNVDAVIAPSNFVAHEIYNKFGIKSKVIHHGVNINLFNPSISKSHARRELGLPMNAKIVLWNDRITPEKDLATLLDAIPMITKDLPNAFFLIKGRAVNRSYLNSFHTKLKLVKQLKNVKISAVWIPQEKLPYLYRASDVFVRTSLLESFGLAVIEAMACGTPVVASDCATFPEIIGDSGLLFKPKCPSDLAEKIVKVLVDKKLSSILMNRGLQRILLKGFTWNVAAERYYKLYEEISSNKG